MTPMEKVRVYHAMIDSLMGERDTTRNTNASLELGFKVLAELGCSFPQSSADGRDGNDTRSVQVKECRKERLDRPNDQQVADHDRS